MNEYSSENINEIKDILSVYYQTTDICCRAFSIRSRDWISCADYVNLPDFCEKVRCTKKGNEQCQKSYLYGGRQAEEIGSYYIYFCPYGLVNWSAPLVIGDEVEYYVFGGPTLIHPVDDLLLDNIFKQNPLLGDFKKVKKSLGNLPYLNPVKTRYMAKLLFRMLKYNKISFQNPEKEKDYNLFKNYMAETIHDLKDRKNSEGSDNQYPYQKEKNIIMKMKAGDRDGASLFLNQLLGHIFFNNGKNFSIVKAKSIELMTVLARAAIEIGADREIIFGLEYMLYQNLNNVNVIDELSDVLSDFLDRFIESTFTLNDVKNKDIIYKAMNFIRNNYYNKKLTLNNVAEEVGLSSSYFSKLFKDDLGFSYSDYLNKVRVEASKELLKNNIAISEIAQAVGFNDQSYFSKVFKKFEGITPGKYN